MSLPNIPDVTPEINVTKEKAANMLLSSIAMEGLGLSHIINAEGEKIQYILGTLKVENINKCKEDTSIEDILRINKSIDRTLSGIIKNQILLQLKLENTLELFNQIDDECLDDECIDAYREMNLDKIIDEIMDENLDRCNDEDDYIECKPSFYEVEE